MQTSRRLAIALLAAPKALADAGLITLAVEAKGDEPPTEFRIFKAGWNDTENGRYLFDKAAAQAVMSAYKKWGVDLAIDLEHQMLEDGIAPDPTAKDARGWCKLELRDSEAGSELWAVSVSWTEDGAARLTQKRQRYISPAFAFDKKTKRVTQILNIAITAMPATHNAQELVAANRAPDASDLRKLSAGPSFADVAGAIQDALKARMPSAPPDYCSPWIVDVFDASCVFQVGATYYEVPYTYANGAVTLGEPAQVQRAYTPVTAAPAPAAEDPNAAAPAANSKATQGAVTMTIGQFLKVCKALGIDLDKMSVDEAMAQIKGEPAADAGDAGDAGDEAAAADGEADPNAEKPNDQEQAAASIAAGRLAMQTTGKSTVSEAMAELARTHKVAVDVEERQAQLAKDQAKLDHEERVKIVRELQKLGVETPATSGLGNGKLCARLANEPIAELRARHAALLAAKGGKVPAVQPPAGDNASGKAVKLPDGTVVELTAEQVAICAETKCSEMVFATMLSKRGTGRPRAAT